MIQVHAGRGLNNPVAKSHINDYIYSMTKTPNKIVFLFYTGALLACFICTHSFAIPVYTDTTYPVITVTDTAEYYKVSINDLERDSLFDVSYAWGTRPSVYAAVSVANDDTANWEFSNAESLRWEYIQQRTVERWDQATYDKHPLNFTFLKSPLLLDQTKQEITNASGVAFIHLWYSDKFESEYAESLITPYIYMP